MAKRACLGGGLLELLQDFCVERTLMRKKLQGHQPISLEITGEIPHRPRLAMEQNPKMEFAGQFLLNRFLHLVDGRVDDDHTPSRGKAAEYTLLRLSGDLGDRAARTDHGSVI